MSEASGGGGRYQRSSGGLIGAMIVTVVAVVGLVGLRAFFTDREPTPVRTVEYAGVATAARQGTDLAVLSPSALPPGWRATSVRFVPGRDASWHLGLLTDEDDYVSVEEQRASIAGLVEKYVDEDAVRGDDVRIAGRVWQSWTDAGGDYAVARTLGSGRNSEAVLVAGSAPPADVRRLAASLPPPER